MVDKAYAMSSFLQFRAVYNHEVKFAEHIDIPHRVDVSLFDARIPINTSEQLCEHIKNSVEREAARGKAALALSGGIDSAICAKFMPKGSVAYTFKCVVPGRKVTDETEKAKKFCETNGLEQRVVEVYWEDFETYAPLLMRHKNAPIHSIEVQIYKAALAAKNDGFDTFIFGEGADAMLGGLSSLLSKDYVLGDFAERYSFVLPYKVLKDFLIVTEPFENFCDENGFIDTHGFIEQQFFWEYINSYCNACECAGIAFSTPFSSLIHKPLDIQRVRSGDSKYLVREVFKKLYPDMKMAEKTPMPRPVDEWFENWDGPKRPEFWPNCHVNMTGDQKYYIWILEKFLNEFNI